MASRFQPGRNPDFTLCWSDKQCNICDVQSILMRSADSSETRATPSRHVHQPVQKYFVCRRSSYRFQLFLFSSRIIWILDFSGMRTIKDDEDIETTPQPQQQQQQQQLSNITYTSHVCVTLTSPIYFLLALAQGKRLHQGGEWYFVW